MLKQKSNSFLKWLFYVLFALLLFCLQTAPERLGIFSDVLFLLPLIISFSCFEDIMPSVAFSVVCGFVVDYSVQRHFGYNALIFCLIAVAVWLVMKFLIRPVFVGVLAASALGIFVYLLFDFFFFYILEGMGSAGALFVSKYIPVLFKTILFSVPISYVCMKIYKLSPQKRGIEL